MQCKVLKYYYNYIFAKETVHLIFIINMWLKPGKLYYF